MQRVAINNGVRIRRRKRQFYDAAMQRRVRANVAFTFHLLKQVIAYFAMIGCIAFGLRCMKLEKELGTYRATLADMYSYQIARGIDFSSNSYPASIVENYKAHIESLEGELVEAKRIEEEDVILKEKLNTVIEEMKEMDLQNGSLIVSNEYYWEQLQAFQNRQNLYDKYSWTLYNKRGERNDITFDQLKTGEDALIKARLDPNLLFALISAESDGDEDAKNPASTATGYGQILHGTGESVYEKVMGNGRGTFEPSMLLDGDMNIKIASAYLVYLKNRSSSVYEIVDKYAGKHSEAYYEKLDEILEKTGSSLADIDKNTYHATEPLQSTTYGNVKLTITPSSD